MFTAGDVNVALFPADTVYGLATDPDSREGVERLYRLKGRGPERPSAVMFFRPESALATLPIVLQDERLSTAAVTRGMIEDYDMSRAKRAERVDAAAAAWILESALARLH